MKETVSGPTRGAAPHHGVGTGGWAPAGAAPAGGSGEGSSTTQGRSVSIHDRRASGEIARPRRQRDARVRGHRSTQETDPSDPRSGG